MPKLNRANLRRLAKFIEDLPDQNQFSMRYLTSYETPSPGSMSECCTSACIAGWAGILQMVDQGFSQDGAFDSIEDGDMMKDEYGYEMSVPDAAASWLGLTLKETEELFTPKRHHADYRSLEGAESYITNEDAVIALNRVADGCKWNRIWDFKKEGSSGK